MLRDKFVSGLHNTCTQHRLLAEKALTFAKAQEIAQAMELADKDVQSYSPLHEYAISENRMLPEGMDTLQI